MMIAWGWCAGLSSGGCGTAPWVKNPGDSDMELADAARHRLQRKELTGPQHWPTLLLPTGTGTGTNG